MAYLISKHHDLQETNCHIQKKLKQFLFCSANLPGTALQCSIE
uniref:Uncharacterized protein n=1 Tax=Rhizophora mucronata TaxID=61149 RepID=A0A2P2NHC2_RHIMU